MKNWPDAALCTKEVKVFIAILTIPGYTILPSKALYRPYDHYIVNKAVSSAMRRDRFEILKKCFYFNANNILDKSEKYSKLHPFISHLETKFMEHFIPSQQLRHDEAMVEYYGKHSCKHPISNKPITFGYKI